MDDSLSNWLALREAADWAARSAGLTARVAAALPSDRTVAAVDLCTGTGSNLRYLMGRLPASQRWLAIDRDEALLSEVPERLAAWAASRGCRHTRDSTRIMIDATGFQSAIETRRLDLGSLPGEMFTECDLVTASALLDLVSTSWLRTLAALCRAAGAAVLFAITYDGRFSCDPKDREDETVREFFNRHQRTDKGLGGPAAGPGAWQAAVAVFRDAGYRVEHEPSDWVIDATAHEFQRQLIEGWASAASEIAPQEAATIARWRTRRLAHVEANHSRLVVHHYDVAGWLPAPPR